MHIHCAWTIRPFAAEASMKGAGNIQARCTLDVCQEQIVSQQCGLGFAVWFIKQGLRPPTTITCRKMSYYP